MKGRKTKYTPERIQKICDLIQEDTYTIPEICERVGISEGTFHRWQSEKNEFYESIKKAEALQYSNMTRVARNSMKKRLEGYDKDEVKTITKNIKHKKTTKLPDGSIVVEEYFKPIKLEETITTKHYAPSDTMIIFYMKNQDAENFGEDKDKKELPDEVTLNFSFGEQDTTE